MSSPTKTRLRAVRLTEGALAELRAALYQQWEESGNRSKLTRETRAEMMGVSVATSCRVLARQGVDRATLTFIYKNMGLSWDDSFCESNMANSDAHPLLQVPSSTLRKRPFRLMLIVGVLITSIAIAAFRLTSGASEGSAKAINVFADLQTAEDQYHKGNYALATRMANQALKTARRDNSAAHAAYALRILGDLAAVKGDFKGASEMYESSLEVKDIFRDERAKPDLLEALGAVQVKAGLIDKAETSFTRALQGFERFGVPGGVAMACRGLGTVAFHRKRYDRSLEWFQKSLSAVQGLKDADQIEADVHGRQALVYRDTGRHQHARDLLQEVLRFWKSKNHSRWIAQTQLNLGTVEAASGHISDAVKLLRGSQLLFEQVGDKAGVADTTRWLLKLSNGGQEPDVVAERS